MKDICTMREGADLLRRLGIDLDRVVKAVITIEVDSIVTVELTKLAEWDPEADEYRQIKVLYAVTKIEPPQTFLADCTDLNCTARKHEVVA